MTDSPQGAEPTGWRKFLFFFGPLLASFHVATYIVGFFSVGAVAKWILDQWFPFTRFLWTEFLVFVGQFINVPELNDVEKDALTTMVFFAPLGLYAIFTRSRHPLDKKYQLFAALIGCFFVLVVGAQLLESIITRVMVGAGFIPETMFGQVVAVLLVVFWAFVAYVEGVSKNEWDTVAGAVVLIGVSTLVVKTTESVLTLGLVTSVCFVLVLLLAGSAILRTPYRLSWSLGSLIVFIGSGLLFELILFIISVIENAPV